jgi:hypothetical protein
VVVLLLVVRRLEVAALATRPVAAALAIRPVVAVTRPAAVGLVIRPAVVAQATHQAEVAVTRPATEHLRGHLATDRQLVVTRPVAGCLARPRPRKNRTR